LLADKGYHLEVSESAREFLAEVGYDPIFGARPLKRAIQRELQDPLAFMVLSGEFKDDDTIRVERGKEGLVFSAAVPVVEGK
jgi:ATP-dependent Clp protease ATP-binding subunit ClpB